MPVLTRRALLAGLAVTPLAGCIMSDEPPVFDPIDYGTRFDNGFQLPAVPAEEVPLGQRRQVVPFELDYDAGRIVVDPDQRVLYLVLRRGYALRYNIAVGPDALTWSGEAQISAMEVWPQISAGAPIIGEPLSAPAPASARASAPLDPAALDAVLATATGQNLPYGARAMSLRSLATGADTGLKIHGTPLRSDGARGPASAGSYRMINHEIIDLFERVEIGTRVSVI